MLDVRLFYGRCDAVLSSEMLTAVCAPSIDAVMLYIERKKNVLWQVMSELDTV